MSDYDTANDPENCDCGYCDTDEPTYEIVRFYQDADTPTEVLETGVTLAEAQEHCNDPETSSRTATSAEADTRTETMGAWFDGYREE